MHVTWEPYWDQFGSRVAFEDPHSNALHFSWAIGEIINASFNDSVLHRQPLGVMSASGESLGTGSKVDNWQAHASSLDLQHNHVYYVMLFVSNDAGLEARSYTLLHISSRWYSYFQCASEFNPPSGNSVPVYCQSLQPSKSL